jgi:methylthioribose-1-phosphate isomerase
VLIKEKIPLVFGVPGESFFNRLETKKIFVAELRPGLEGLKVAALSALEKGIQPVVICDNMLAFCMKQGLVKNVYIFYNILKKDFSLCRTGSLSAALCAKMHGIPVYLGKGAAVSLKPASLHKIDGKQVTSGDIKTCVPLMEKVPLGLISKVR